MMTKRPNAERQIISSVVLHPQPLCSIIHMLPAWDLLSYQRYYLKRTMLSFFRKINRNKIKNADMPEVTQKQEMMLVVGV